MPPLGTLLFMAYVRVALQGGPVTDVYAQQVHQQLSAPWSTLGSYWTALGTHHWRLFSYPTGNWVDAMNLALALGMLALAVPARRVLGTPLWLYALATWVVALCIHQSTARYMLTVFPALIALAVWAPGRWTKANREGRRPKTAWHVPWRPMSRGRRASRRACFGAPGCSPGTPCALRVSRARPCSQ